MRGHLYLLDCVGTDGVEVYCSYAGTRSDISVAVQLVGKLFVVSGTAQLGAFLNPIPSCLAGLKLTFRASSTYALLLVSSLSDSDSSL